ncbi:ABC transporter ATP-binding protein [Salinibacterium sp. M195]|uniref:ABC transporter ATP-binding protein n=1 Tax=Salinibacterium sp. M195 TaxID=2583374 RepID=UPI00210757DC|nr:ABC transporter ATP-binding protein [Salinibacterium sp. M195]
MKKSWNLYRELLSVLPAKAQRFLVRYSISLSLLSTLDAAALGLLAVVIGPIVSGTDPSFPLIGTVSTNGLLVALGLICLLIIMKGVLSIVVIWRATRVFANFELVIGSRLFDSYLKSTWTERLKRNSADVVRLTDSSVSAMVSSYLRPITTLPGEVFSFVTVVIVLAFVQPLVALTALIYLSLLGMVLFFWVTKRSREAGRVGLRFSLRSSRLITEMVGALKEVTLRNKSQEAAEVVRANRRRTTQARSNAQFLAQVPRFILESGLIGGFVVVGLVGLATGGVAEATSAVALFGLAGFRMAPSVVRFQSIVSQMATSEPQARAVLAEIKRSESSTNEGDDLGLEPLPDKPKNLRLSDVTFEYSPGATPALDEVTLNIPFGSTVAFVGASGAGKSTIVDILLGLMSPTAGTVDIDGVALDRMTRAWRDHVAYVPQDVALFDATVAQNVALTWTNDLDEDKVREALRQAQLLDTIESRDGGIQARIGERGLSLSGGQRQRLGIARALYAEPLFLVMDEATSALDTTTEAAVGDAIRRLKGSMTIVTVAHRLSTVKEADQIFFMRDGKVVEGGTFDELVAKVPDFAIQAKLAGLGPRED